MAPPRGRILQQGSAPTRFSGPDSACSVFLLDTKVLSRIMRLEANPSVLRLPGLPEPASPASVCMHENPEGPSLPPGGRRRTEPARLSHERLAEAPPGGTSPLIRAGARHAADACARAEHAGKRSACRDASVAGTAREHGATLVARETEHLERARVRVLEPWAA